jgi:hypothetical protein
MRRHWSAGAGAHLLRARLPRRRRVPLFFSFSICMVFVFGVFVFGGCASMD